MLGEHSTSRRRAIIHRRAFDDFSRDWLFFRPDIRARLQRFLRGRYKANAVVRSSMMSADKAEIGKDDDRALMNRLCFVGDVAFLVEARQSHEFFIQPVIGYLAKLRGGPPCVGVFSPKVGDYSR
jgi:hypothetical protein